MALQAIRDNLYSRGIFYCLFAIAMLAAVMTACALPTRSIVRMDTLNVKRALSLIPDLQPRQVTTFQDYTYSLSLYYTDIDRQQTMFAITPAGCVTEILVNHISIPVPKVTACRAPAGTYWDVYEHPLYIDLKPYIRNGRTLVEVKSLKGEFNIGPVILSGDHLSTWLGLAMVLVASIMVMLIAQRVIGDNYAGYILTGAFLMYMNRLSHMGISQYSMDLPGHIDYIAYIARNWRIPDPFTGWSYFHAPFYYIIGAIIISLADAMRCLDGFTLLQLFSVCCMLTLDIFGILIIRRLIASPWVQYLMMLLLVFYPSGILAAPRVDSHLLYYVFYSGCIYFTLCWLQSANNTAESARSFGRIIIMLGMALATRANSLMLIPLILLAIGVRIVKYGWPTGLLLRRSVRISLIILCLGIVASVGRIEYYRVTRVHHGAFLVGNVYKQSRLLFLHTASAESLLVPDIPRFFDNPWWSTVDNAEGRQNFWTSMLKSSLFGEFAWAHKQWLGEKMTLLLFCLILYVVDGYIVHQRALRVYTGWWICIASLFIPIAALMEDRVLNPLACSQDFRYIYPSLISFCGLFGMVLEQHIRQWRPFRKALGIALCLTFIEFTLAFYLM